MVLRSFAKLNLYLEVLGIRKDGFHSIKTLFERISLFDEIIITSRRDKKIKIICNHPDISLDQDNLVYKSAVLLQDCARLKQGVNIKIIKRIPVAAGLGGGSSNAASVLLGLNRFWKLNLRHDKLIALAKKIGSDVSFFLYNVPFALATGRGEKIKPLKVLRRVRLWHILVVPKIKVSSARIYKSWDEWVKKGDLTHSKYNVKILTLGLRKRGLPLIGQALFNSLEPITQRLYPEVRLIKDRLKRLGLKSILMSGSGPAIFGITSRKEALRLAKELKKEKGFWQIFVVKTV
ncbi:MAG: 4-(cytidine 5'-diphospho)-2-C-methyl-D-erythritol kinase [Candidatus Omnitrophica bacterium]|nr:4-(cytidine 5'-diphospho)-2-C-methyl-D-erythritol kinase [Candidatus Omnitrophota bacterium]